MSKSRLARVIGFCFVPLLLPIAVASSVQASPRFSEPPVSFDKRNGSVAVADPISEPLFGSHVEYGAGNWPNSVAAADLNGDGRIDLAVANSEGDSVSVLLGIGDGTFGLATQFAAGDQSRFVAIADFNADGRPDLAVANGISNSVSVLLGVGDGTFEGSIDVGTGRNPVSLAVDDLDLDGKLDIAVANNDGHSVSILLGNGDGTFGPRSDLDIGTWIGSVATEDLDADGLPDLVVASHVDDHIYVLLGTGGGDFGAKRLFRGDWSAQEVAIGDLDADGRQDIVAASWNYGTVAVLRGNGDGTFADKAGFAAGEGPVAVALADLDRDGRLDVSVTSYMSSTISVLLGDGAGRLGSSKDFDTARGPVSLTIADFNADGRPDMAVASASSSTVSVLLNRGAPAPPVTVAFKFGPSTLNLASPGRWVTGTIVPLPPLSARDIDVTSIRLNGSVPVDWAHPVVPGGPNVNGAHELRVRFERAAVEATLSPGTRVPVSITGTVNGQEFLGTDTIRVRRGTGPIAVDIEHESSAGENPPALSVRAWSVGSAADGQLRVECVLPNRTPARLDLVDVAGRVLVSRQVGELDAGRHTIELAAEHSLPQGIYFLRLTQAGRVARARTAVLR